MSDIYKKSLEYHENGNPGKIEISTTKPLDTQEELSLAYSPGVAGPSLEIAKDKSNSYKYTMKGNTVAVISDGSAVLGLGDIGPDAAFPVMEGKCALLKKFANIDGIPICLDNVRLENGKTDPKKVIEVVKCLAPNYGGIILEDFASPACFEIEQTLEKELDIPVFHDDQHGTAIISLAGLLNGLILTKKKIEEIIVVVNGAGAAGLAICDYYINAGVRKENLLLCDSKGVIYKGRSEGMNSYKEKYRNNTDKRTLKDAFKNADVFIGVSKGDILTSEDIKLMNDKPIIFAMANPTPEIMPDIAKEAGAYIVGTGRSDFPNQVNNVLGFPGLFRGALDMRVRDITTEMKIQASTALAQLAREKIDEDTMKILKEAYPEDYKNGVFDGDNPLKPEYVIPKPFDPRVVERIANRI